MYKKPKGRNCESKHVDDLLDTVFKNKRMSQKYYETMVVAFWGKIVGRVIEKHTQNVEVRRGTVYVTLDSPGLIQELMMNRTSLIKLINKEVEKDIVNKIVFVDV